MEIELPIVNLNNEAVDFSVVHRLTAAFLAHFGFTATGYDEEGQVYAAVHEETGDVFSYDCSYNNMEFSFGKETTLRAVHSRFKEYYSFVQAFFRPFNHTLTGMGINPHRELNRTEPIANGRYKMLFHHLSSFTKYACLPMYFHRYPQFGMFSSASQVQLDVSREKLPEVIRTFNTLEPIKGLLFANSVLLGEDEDLLCCRDMLWENSTHGINPHNVGMYDCDIRTEDDLLHYISTASIYCAEREGHYLCFPPVNILDYFTLDSLTGEYAENGKLHRMTFQPRPEDIAYLRTFKFEDLSFRGTIEFRSACEQPVRDIMTVAAFQTGLMEVLPELNERLDNAGFLYDQGYSYLELRELLVKRHLPDFVREEDLEVLLGDVIDLAAEGLRRRGRGEEKFVQNLYSRAAHLMSPARVQVEGLESGVPLEYYINDYAALD